VADRADIHVRLTTVKFFIRHVLKILETRAQGRN